MHLILTKIHYLSSLMYLILQKDFKRVMEHNHNIRRNFESRSATCLHNIFTNIHKFEQRLFWIGENVWSDLYRAQVSLDYIHKREYAK